MKDVMLIVTNKGFWLIALLCVLFYSAVFPFIKYATDLMVQKYNVDPKLGRKYSGITTDRYHLPDSVVWYSL